MKNNVKRHAVVQPLDQSIKIIPLTRGKSTIVDADDYHWLMQWNWQSRFHNGRWYASRSRTRGDAVLMHREICRTSMPEVDHKDHNTLNNRKENLRPCTSAQNQWNTRAPSTNTSGFKGVSWSSYNRKWLSQAVFNKETYFLGYYKSPIEAALIYQLFASVNHGEFVFQGGINENS